MNLLGFICVPLHTDALVGIHLVSLLAIGVTISLASLLVSLLCVGLTISYIMFIDIRWSHYCSLRYSYVWSLILTLRCIYYGRVMLSHHASM